MTEHQLNNFDEDQMHVWIPEFTKDAPEQDKLWITFAYSVALNCGFENRYEFYLSDWYTVVTDHVTDAWAYKVWFNQKYGDWIKIGHQNGNKAFFVIQRDDWNFVEHYVPPGIWQRKWVHLMSQTFDHNGFRYDVFEPDELDIWPSLMSRKAWSSVTQEDAWWMSNYEKGVVGRRLKANVNLPVYLQPPGIKAGKRVKYYRGGHLAPVNHKLKQRDD